MSGILRRALLPLAAAALAACQASLPYQGHPKFSFEYPEGWAGPSAIDDGVRFQTPDGAVCLEAAYHPAGTKAYRTPGDFRRTMREQGTTADSHIIEEVKLATGTAYQVLFTTHEYDPRYLLGAKKEVLTTALLMAPDRDGIFVMRLQAPRRTFGRVLRHWRHALKTLALEPPALATP
ncbi:MAG: hypothetical protein A2X36_01625 [Elusimicrobia bacterium GWA2_69_24]|nr:MAG: hypothetical protein A2X36_01625 [Elusimicrobia bacterium GWA2_69_24]HBL19139.1 hypothetical protein [Elusimicrobiota bacterium]